MIETKECPNAHAKNTKRGCQGVGLWPALLWLAAVGTEGFAVVEGIAEEDGIRAKPDADVVDVEDEVGTIKGVAVESRLTVVVLAMVLGGAEAIEGGIAMVEVAEGNGESNEPCISSMLEPKAECRVGQQPT